ncbi:MAG: aminotransferase class V-fold PLP-dependent enzyme [Synergistaceae bacterium]|jgi:cysteine desulfurase family protein|nr:aminotransferase class V-fold PLP-dependent enzyme [Synergistaceae bacterium]
MPIYFDNGATSNPKPESVYSAVLDYMRGNGASPGRGNYALARDADDLVYRTRKALCKLLGAKRPSEIIFTSNATESINMALKGYLKRGDKVITTGYEHNAMWRPLKKLEEELDVKVELLPCSHEGRTDTSPLPDMLRGASLVAVAHGSNVAGCLSPLEEIVAAAHEAGVPVLADAAQTAGVYPINLSEIHIDMLAFTGHKGLMGPTGTGGLYLREGLELRTLKEGGTGGMSESPYPPNSPPDRYEAGTMNICGIAGLNAAVDFLLGVGVEQVRAHEIRLTETLINGLNTIPRAAYYGPRLASDRLGLVSFNLDGISANEVALKLDEDYGIMVRAGLHCAPQAHRVIGTERTGAVRASVGYFNTEEDVTCLIGALSQIALQPSNGDVS